MAENVIPQKCTECAGGEFQRENCAYRKAQRVMDINEEMKDMGFPGAFDPAPYIDQLRVDAQACLAEQKEYLKTQLPLMRYEELSRAVESMQEDVRAMKAAQADWKAVEGSIIRPAKPVSAPVKEVQHEMDVKEELTTGEGKIPVMKQTPNGEGWFTYSPNLMKKSMATALGKLAKKYPILQVEVDRYLQFGASPCIQVKKNKKNKKYSLRFRFPE